MHQIDRLIDLHWAAVAPRDLDRAAALDAAVDIKVSLNNDTVCTERLASLAAKSDLFVFAWRSSKHAA